MTRNRPLSDQVADAIDERPRIPDPYRGGDRSDPRDISGLRRSEAFALLALDHFEETGEVHPELGVTTSGGHHSLFDVMLAELRQAGLTFFGPADESHPIFRRHRLNEHGKRIVAELHRRSRS